MYKLLVLLLLILLLAGCSAPGGGRWTVPGAVEQMTLELSSVHTLTPPETRLTRLVGGHTFVFTAFDADDGAGRNKVKIAWIVSASRTGAGWHVTGAGERSSHPLDKPLPPVQFFTGTVDDNGDTWSTAYGLVSDPAVRTLGITFAEGAQQQVAVENGAYLAVQEGSVAVTQIEALDEHGSVLHNMAATP